MLSKEDLEKLTQDQLAEFALKQANLIGFFTSEQADGELSEKEFSEKIDSWKSDSDGKGHLVDTVLLLRNKYSEKLYSDSEMNKLLDEEIPKVNAHGEDPKPPNEENKKEETNEKEDKNDSDQIKDDSSKDESKKDENKEKEDKNDPNSNKDKPSDDACDNKSKNKSDKSKGHEKVKWSDLDYLKDDSAFCIHDFNEPERNKQNLTSMYPNCQYNMSNYNSFSCNVVPQPPVPTYNNCCMFQNQNFSNFRSGPLMTQSFDDWKCLEEALEKINLDDFLQDKSENKK